MQPDYHNAMNRHWRDAEVLYGQDPRCLGNADHLYGFAAECGLKFVMYKSGTLKLNKDGKPMDGNGVHINNLWRKYKDITQGKDGVMSVLPAANPFENWDVNKRYANDTEFSQSQINEHREGAKKVIEEVDKFMQEKNQPNGQSS